MDATMDEVSDVIRLVRETCDMWDDPRAWREHLLHGACRLLGGHVGMMLADHDGERGWFGNLAVISLVGVSPPMRALVQPVVSRLDQHRYEDVSDNIVPGMSTLWAEMQRQGWVTTTCHRIAEPATYHASPIYHDLFQRIDCDDYVVSIRVVDVPPRPEAISIDRPHGAAPFGEREITLLKLLHDEIAPLVGVRLTTEEHLSRDGLSKRLRETLSLLLAGQSEKQVASSLNLRTRTVHDYVTRLYQHFEVSSRAELLAYFIRRTPVPRGQGFTVTAS
jgi:DNA-binding CsgD family transcriptional regulator